MTYALLDNATLSAVQRVLGDAEISNPDTINGDLLAFENLILAILFFYQLICIDNYKAEYRQQRSERFPFVRFLLPNEIGLQEVEAEATRAAASIKPAIIGGKFEDNEFSELLELLKLNMTCTWDLRSSVYYLTMKMLGQPNTAEYEKYSQLSSTIYSELVESSSTKGYWSKEVRLVSSNGQEFTEEDFKQARDLACRGFGGTTKALDMFIASLNWLAFKTIYYSMTARYLEADTFLHPIRHAYQLNWMSKNGVYGSDIGTELINSLSQATANAVTNVISHGRSASIKYSLPVFSAALIQQAGSPSAVLELALELRKENAISEVRGALREIKNAYHQEGYEDSSPLITKWTKYINAGCEATLAKYGIATEQGIPSTTLINIYNSVAPFTTGYKVPGFNFNIPYPEILKSKRTKAFGTVIRDVVAGLTTIERLGTIRDQLAIQFRYKENWDEIYRPPKTEDPSFTSYSSNWKIPM